MFGLAWSPDSRRLVIAGGGGTVKLWDWATQQELLTLRGREARVDRAQFPNWITVPFQLTAFSSDGWRLTAANPDGTVILWDATPPD